jgi:SAM-dependent methyltransferase
MSDPISVFDRALVRRHRERAARGGAEPDFLFREVAARLADRLGDIDRRFESALDLGCRRGAFAGALASALAPARLVQSDLAFALVAQAPAGPGHARLAADEEALPFSAGAFDLVVSALALNWVNDLPGTLVQIARCLSADGLLLAVLFGGETLRELREALAEAELAEEGGVSPRVSPFIDIGDAGALLQRAGFALPVVDSETLTATYAEPLALLRELGAMGESNALARRRRAPLRRATLARALALYARHHGTAEGRVRATFQLLTLTAWKPHPSQPRPLRPGSGARRLADALDAEKGAVEPSPPLRREQGAQSGDQRRVGRRHRIVR